MPPPRVLWIVIGTNNLAAAQCNVHATLAGIIAIVDAIQNQVPRSTVVVHSILPRGPGALWQGNAHWRQTHRLNRLLACYARKQGNGVSFFNGTNLFLTPDRSQIDATLMPDYVHPTGRRAAMIWGEAIVRRTLELLGKPPPNPALFQQQQVNPQQQQDSQQQQALHPPDNAGGDGPDGDDDDDDISEEDPALVQARCAQHSFATTGDDWTAWKDAVSQWPQPQWCRLAGCTCPNPTQPRNQAGWSKAEGWERAFQRNQDLAAAESKRAADPSRRALDVLLVGDSIVEHWLGTDLAMDRTNWEGNHHLYQALLRTEEASPSPGAAATNLFGLALGIGGDQTAHLLYRLLNGELPDGVNPSIVWIVVGTNNLIGGNCNVNATLAGIVQVVETVHALRPQAMVVVHSILPRGRASLLDNGSPWRFMRVLNQQLECYCRAATTSTSRVEFFNGTDYFLSNDKTKVNRTLMPDFLHPGGLGSVRWGHAIVRKSLQLLGRATDDLPPVQIQYPKPVFHNPAPADQLFCGDARISADWTAWKDEQAQLPHDLLCAKPNCSCAYPTRPQHMEGCWNPGSWDRAFARNQQLLQQEVHDAANERPLDVLLLGDSLFEHWLGTNKAVPNPGYQGNLAVYQRLFRNPDSLIRGIAAGIGGDQTAHVLYRLENGELPDAMDPPLIWVMVGTNNIIGGYCNIRGTFAGLIQIVETLQRMRPQATIVLHSILPRDRIVLQRRDSPWTVIRVLNRNLECYAASTDRVEFFNGTDFFLTNDKRKVNDTLMPDYLHPKEIGSVRWGEAIVHKSLQLLGREAPPPPGEEDLSKLRQMSSCRQTLQSKEQALSWDDWIHEQSSAPRQDWCYPNARPTACRCMDPLVPRPRDADSPENIAFWQESFQRNQELARIHHNGDASSSSSDALDMVMVGDSIVEFWTGFFLNQPLSNLQANKPIFQELFQSPNSLIQSMGLGISGDVSPELLYRLQNGELPDGLNPRIWWLLIGTNDIGRNGCNAGLTSAGILTVVQTIQQARPDATIILNALLPREQGLMSENPVWREILQVNEHLSCYASEQANIRFVNDSDLFLTRDQSAVNQTMLGDWLHPSTLGYRIWGERIVQVALDILGDEGNGDNHMAG